MNQLTAHKEEYSRNRGDLYLAFELGSKEWKLGFSVGERFATVGRLGRWPVLLQHPIRVEMSRGSEASARRAIVTFDRWRFKLAGPGFATNPRVNSVAGTRNVSPMAVVGSGGLGLWPWRESFWLIYGDTWRAVSFPRGPSSKHRGLTDS